MTERDTGKEFEAIHVSNTESSSAGNAGFKDSLKYL